MRAWNRTAWRDGYLDYSPENGRVRVQASRLLSLGDVESQYFAPSTRDVRKLVFYLKEVGLRDAERKVRSRISERARNAKVALLVEGVALDGSARRVVGLATNTNVVERPLVDFETTSDQGVANGRIELRSASPSQIGVDLIGWDYRSGNPPPEATAAKSLLACFEEVWRQATPLSELFGPPSPVHERVRGSHAGRLTVFGYGHYAKTLAIPELTRRIPLNCVHEVDPMQIGPDPGARATWDTSGVFRADESVDVCLVAGYHHTHASLACEALYRGASAVVIEKPAATTTEDLKALAAAAKSSGSPVFVGYQKRYHRWNNRLRSDLGLSRTDAISMFGVVHEVPLPVNHWYRWPISGTRVLSNGSHWIDYFHFLNSYDEPLAAYCEAVDSDSIAIRARLRNGANLALILTSLGSSRLGVREHIELRARGGTAVISDGRRYLAETDHRVLRSIRHARLQAHRDMYRDITTRIANGDAGDNIDDLGMGGELVLRLNDSACQQDWK